MNSKSQALTTARTIFSSRHTKSTTEQRHREILMVMAVLGEWQGRKETANYIF